VELAPDRGEVRVPSPTVRRHTVAAGQGCTAGRDWWAAGGDEWVEHVQWPLAGPAVVQGDADDARGVEAVVTVRHQVWLISLH
jgi:hypothetical protein